MLPNMEIRNATAAEVQECENVLRAAFEDYVQKLGRKQSEDAYSWLPEAASQKRVLVAIDNSVIHGVAICAVSSGSWSIEQVAVNPRSQGRGIGSALIERIEQDATAAGVHILELDTAEIMTDLLRLYRRHGFEIARKGLPKHGRDQFVRVFMQKTI